MTTPTHKTTFNVTNNISRTTFEYVKNNPGSTRKEIVTALEHQGFNPASTSSLIAQMVRNHMIHATNGLYYADITEYRPIKTLKALMKEGKTVPKRKYEKKTAGIGALLKAKIESAPDRVVIHADTEAPKRSTIIVRSRTPQDILKDMTVYQAHDLYVHLKEMFGG